MRRFGFGSITLAVSLLAPPVMGDELRVSLDGIRSPNGSIIIGLYDTAESFQRALAPAGQKGSFLNDPTRFAAVALRANAAMKSAVVFTNLDPGHYALIAFHDENGNGRLDKGFFGIPSEPYGFGNDASGGLGPPSFEASSILVEGNAEVRIRLRSPGGSR